MSGHDYDNGYRAAYDAWSTELEKTQEEKPND